METIRPQQGGEAHQSTRSTEVSVTADVRVGEMGFLKGQENKEDTRYEASQKNFYPAMGYGPLAEICSIDCITRG